MTPTSRPAHSSRATSPCFAAGLQSSIMVLLVVVCVGLVSASPSLAQSPNDRSEQMRKDASVYSRDDKVQVYDPVNDKWIDGTVREVRGTMIIVDVEGAKGLQGRAYTAADLRWPEGKKTIEEETAEVMSGVDPNAGGPANAVYNPGDKVEVRWLRSWMPGTVLRQTSGGVKVSTNRFPRGMTFRTTDVRPRGGATSSNSESESTTSGESSSGAQARVTAVRHVAGRRIEAGAEVRVRTSKAPTGFAYGTVLRTRPDSYNIAFYDYPGGDDIVPKSRTYVSDQAPFRNPYDDPSFRDSTFRVNAARSDTWRGPQGRRALEIEQPQDVRGGSVNLDAPSPDAVPDGLVVRPKLKRVFMSFQTPGDNPSLTIHDVDALTGSKRGEYKLVTDGSLVDISHDGALALVQTARQTGRMQVWQIKDDVKPIVSFQPFVNSVLAWAGFSEDGKVVTSAENGWTVGWNIPDVSPAWVVSFNRQPIQGLVTQKAAWGHTDSGPALIDLNNGKPIQRPLGSWEGDTIGASLSPDGLLLAAISKAPHGVVIHPLSGRDRVLISLPRDIDAVSPQWINNDLILLGDGYVVSHKARGIVGRYVLPEGRTWQLVNQELWAIIPTEAGGKLRSFTIPHDALAEHAGQSWDKTLSVLDQDPTFSLSIDASSRVRDFSEERAKRLADEAGLTIREGRPLVLTITEDDRGTFYLPRTSGQIRMPRVKRVTVTVSWTYNGQVISLDQRKIDSDYRPQNVGGDIEAAVERDYRAAFAPVENFQLPDTIHPPLSDIKIVAAALTADGFEDAPALDATGENPALAQQRSGPMTFGTWVEARERSGKWVPGVLIRAYGHTASIAVADRQYGQSFKYADIRRRYKPADPNARYPAGTRVEVKQYVRRWSEARVIDKLGSKYVVKLQRPIPGMVRKVIYDEDELRPLQAEAQGDSAFRATTNHLSVKPTNAWIEKDTSAPFVIDPAPSTDSTKARLPLAGKIDNIIIRPNLNKAFVSFQPDDDVPELFVDAIDLETGQSRPVLTAGTTGVLADISLDGTQALVMTEGDDGQVQIWEMSDVISKIVSFQPYHGAGLTSAFFAGNDTVVTSSNEGIAFGWRMPQVEAVWAIAFLRHLQFSTIRPHIMQRMGLGNGLRGPVTLDLRTGEVLRKPYANWINTRGGQYSADGKRIVASYSQDNIAILGIEKGTRTMIHVPKGTSNDAPHWLDDDLILLHDGHIVSVKAGGIVARIDYPEDARRRVVGNRVWYVMPDGDNAVVNAVDLPQAAVTAFMQGEVPHRSMMHRGRPVRLEIKISNAGLRQRAAARANALVKERGLVVDPQSPFVVEVTHQTLKPEKATFRAFGEEAKTVTITPVRITVRCSYNGEQIWERQRGTYVGSDVYLNEGETLEQHFARQRKKVETFVDEFELPESLHLPLSEVEIVTAKVDARGLTEASRDDD